MMQPERARVTRASEATRRDFMRGRMGRPSRLANPQNKQAARRRPAVVGAGPAYSVSDTANVTFVMFALARQSRTLITRS
jgi:hypothetical protein